MTAQSSLLGIIGGSGLYRMEGLVHADETVLDTPFGSPSDAYVVGRLGNQRVAFLPRHGIGHRLAPGELNYRANIHGFKQLGADAIVSISAVGSLREEISPGHVVVPDQFIDRTRGRISTFFGGGCVAHVSFADPFCSPLSKLVAESVRDAGATVHEGGTYVCMEGPMFSTRAESHLYRSWGASVIGMTNLQEAKLAREAEICFATIALATDYDCWRTETDDVAVTDILAVLEANVELARRAVVRIAAGLAAVRRTCNCGRALDHAVITSPQAIPPATRERLKLLIGRLT
ncbi:MAG TPA: S-methyl-5'-thioadenosine phosphorylase [Candidatus Limnocylindrales bacterium]|jgi:5'-methylthioadenosine phosphorylase|nr:S-methyl-5'-thioadenosine phosphorylase [Candidatus Limnocylindrales bacterium]